MLRCTNVTWKKITVYSQAKNLWYMGLQVAYDWCKMSCQVNLTLLLWNMWQYLYFGLSALQSEHPNKWLSLLHSSHLPQGSSLFKIHLFWHNSHTKNYIFTQVYENKLETEEAVCLDWSLAGQKLWIEWHINMSSNKLSLVRKC